MSAKTDILNRDDVQVFVYDFYAKVQLDDLLAPHFKHVDWSHHLPLLVNFWSSVLFGDLSYQGNPFGKHKDLPLSTDHFNRWLKLFIETIDGHFQGFNAEEAKNRAKSVASLFQYKLGLMPKDNP